MCDDARPDVRGGEAASGSVAPSKRMEQRRDRLSPSAIANGAQENFLEPRAKHKAGSGSERPGPFSISSAFDPTAMEAAGGHGGLSKDALDSVPSDNLGGDTSLDDLDGFAAPRRSAHERSGFSGASTSGTTSATTDLQGLKLVHDFALKQAAWVAKSNLPKQPWETDCMSAIFAADEPFAQNWESKEFVPLPEVLDSAGTEQPRKKTKVWLESVRPGPSFHCVVDSGSHQGASPDQVRQDAINKWLVVIRANAVCFELAMGKDASQMEPEELRLSLEAAVGVKSPLTLRKRVGSVFQYMEWSEAQVGRPAFPLTEQQIWSYFNELKVINAAASRASSFLEAVNFMVHVLGMKSDEDVRSSKRLMGLSNSLLAAKGVWRQAEALSTAHVTLLHRLLEDEGYHRVDRYAAGVFLFCIYSRSRWSDVRSLHSLSEDISEGTGFLEATTRFHKGSKSAEKKCKLLPLTAVARGITGGCWPRTFMSLRKELGLGLEEPVGPLLPSVVDNSGGWSEFAMTSTNATKLLRSLLGVPIGKPGISSHSMKATSLAWCAKFGVLREHRLLLGRHTSSVATADSYYARDILSEPLRALQMVVDSIRSSEFFPDATRSGRFTSELGCKRSEGGERAREAPQDSRAEAVISSESEQCVSSDVDLSGSGSNSPDEGSSVNMKDIPKATEWQGFVMHKKSRIVHVLDFLSNGKTMCGREVSNVHEPVNADFAAKAVRCMRCK